MHKVFLVICLAIATFLLPGFTYGQKNIGEFNRKEQPILESLDKEFNALGFASWIGFGSGTVPVNELTQYIPKAKQIITKSEGRIQNCRNAIKDLSEIPSIEIKSNDEFKSWTESLIGQYEAIVKTIKLNIETAESRIKLAKEEASKAKATIAGNSTSSRQTTTSLNETRNSNNTTSSSANKIAAEFERREIERSRVTAAATHATNVITTNYYALQNAHQNLQGATNLKGNFDNIEELNRVFEQKLREVSQMGDELRVTSVQAAQDHARALTAANATTASDYVYGEAIGALGGIAASISAAKAEKKAREELAEQRDAHERSIKARQLKALIDIREEIDKMFPEGGMPLSSHNINAPALYLFAYTSNKEEWEQDKTVPMTVSNVIPVYRYSDGSYPYVSNVKRFFENSGVNNPIIVGYFTDKATAEKYQQSLIGIADQGRFQVSYVDIRVKEKDINQNASVETDFWDTGSTQSNRKSTASATEVDFWETSVKDNKSEKKEPIVETKANDFWSN